MFQSFSEFKFYQSFRVPVDSVKDLQFSLQYDNLTGQLVDINATLLDISTTGIGFKSTESFVVGDIVEMSIQYRKLRVDVAGKIIRIFGEALDKKTFSYGVEIDIDDQAKMKKVIEHYILGMHPDKLKEMVCQLSLQEKYNKVDSSFEMLSLLLSLYRDIITFSEKDGFLDSLMEEISRIFNAQRGSVFLINPSTNELESVSSIGINKSRLKFDYRMGIAGTVFTTGVTLNINTEDDKMRFTGHMDKLSGYETRSLLCSPIHNSEEKIIGVLQVINKRNRERFTEEDERLMKVVSLIISSIFHNFNPLSERSLIRRFSSAYDREYALVGKSPFATELRKSIVQMKDIDAALHIEGEAGIGKRLLAKIIHNEGKRGLANTVTIDCKGVDVTELEAKLFGALGIKSQFEECHEGTVVINEVCHLPLATQERLFRVLTSKKLEGNIPFNCRIITTSSRDLKKMCDQGDFYPNLRDFLTEATIKMQPLRRHKQDVLDLLDYFMKKECKLQGLLPKQLDENVKAELMDYDWPGNIEELKQAMKKIVLYNPKAHVIRSIKNDISPILLESASAVKGLDEIPHVLDRQLDLKDRVALIEREVILSEIKIAGGNKSKAAKNMGISREALRKKLLICDEILSKMNIDHAPIEDAFDDFEEAA